MHNKVESIFRIIEKGNKENQVKERWNRKEGKEKRREEN